MDRLDAYRAALTEIVGRVGGYFDRSGRAGVESAVIADRERDQYGLYRVGWEAGARVNRPVLLARIKGGKVWVEEDYTDLTFADELVRAGVPRSDIVLAFHPPELRHLTDFAVA